MFQNHHDFLLFVPFQRPPIQWHKTENDSIQGTDQRHCHNVPKAECQWTHSVRLCECFISDGGCGSGSKQRDIEQDGEDNEYIADIESFQIGAHRQKRVVIYCKVSEVPALVTGPVHIEDIEFIVISRKTNDMWLESMASNGRNIMERYM